MTQNRKMRNPPNRLHPPLEDTYQAVAVSTSHLSPTDNMRLFKEASHGDAAMVTSRNTGYFMKLYEEQDDNWYGRLSDSLNMLIAHLHRRGFRLIEFDADAPVVEGFATFEW